MQRVRIGLTGLAVVFLLVLLTAALFRLVTHETIIKTDPAGNAIAVEAGNKAGSEQPKDPLAELGVAPGHGTDTTPANGSVPANGPPPGH